MKRIVYVLCIMLLLPSVFAFVQNGTYFQYDDGQNNYLEVPGTTITIPSGGGRTDVSQIERDLATLKEMVSALNKTNATSTNTTYIQERITELSTMLNNLLQSKNATEGDIDLLGSKLDQLIAESKGGTMQILSQSINLELYPNEYTETIVLVKNNQNFTSNVHAQVEGQAQLKEFINIQNPDLSLASGSEGYINLSIFIPKEAQPAPYYGNIVITSGNATLPSVSVNIRVLQPRDKLLDIKVVPITDVISPGQTLRVDTTLYNTGGSGKIDVQLIIQLIDPSTSSPITEQTQRVIVETTTSTITDLNISNDIAEGRYIIRGIAQFTREGAKAQETSIAYVTVRRSFFEFAIFGIPVWIILGLLTAILVAYIAFIIYKRDESRKRRYLETIELRTLPQPGPRSGFVGRLAETAMRAFFDVDKLTTHVLIAGATGSGKTIASQVLVEEALQKNISVLVFDPTAQWTGFLRKNKDKGMFALYGKFGMKEKDSKSFNGNIYIVKDASQKIDIKKYQKPGEITIFCLNRLETPDIETFVSNAIRDSFITGFEETYELKNLIIIDEVHRLLPKFGGSGSGLTQVEHAVREFRKWGIGVLLISQVLSDFVGEIKANVGTEIQMRTRYEGDLERIKMKYGEDILKSIVKASVGTGMLQNAEYNKGRPYFVSFRPIVHSIQRLSDKELDLYDKFNTKIEELKTKLDKLKEASVDVFDLDLELNLALDNVKKGSFDVAKLYLESLEPRINTEYDGKFKGAAPEERKPRTGIGTKFELKREPEEKPREFPSEKFAEKPSQSTRMSSEMSYPQDEEEKTIRQEEPPFGGNFEDKIKEKIEGKRKGDNVDVSSLGLTSVTSEETSDRGPEIKKVTSRKNQKVFVYLTVKNNQRTPLKGVYVIDPLPEDASSLEVVTHEGFDEKSKEKFAKWSLGTLGMKEKRILHYTVETKLDRLPTAKLQWSESKDDWHDIKDVWKAIEEKKPKDKK